MASTTTPATLAVIGSIYLGAWPGKKACEKTMRAIQARIGMILEADVTIMAGKPPSAIAAVEASIEARNRLTRHCEMCGKCELGRPR